MLRLDGRNVKCFLSHIKKFRVWNKQDMRFAPDDAFFMTSKGDIFTFMETSIFLDKVYVIDFCTGVKDETGKDIYENDIVTAKFVNSLNGVKAEVKNLSVKYDSYLCKFIAGEEFEVPEQFVTFVVEGNCHEK